MPEKSKTPALAVINHANKNLQTHTDALAVVNALTEEHHHVAKITSPEIANE